VLGHALNPPYCGALATDAGALDPPLASGAVLASMPGTLLARPLLAALTERQYRLWAGRLVPGIAGFLAGPGHLAAGLSPETAEA
jgi:hypothetical protein